MENQEFDVVVVGSGIAGSIVCKILTNAGKKVLLLEAGLKDGIEVEQESSYKIYNEYLQTFYNASIKAPNSPYPNIKNAQSIDALDIQLPAQNDPARGYLIQKGPLPFGSDNLRAPGGTTLHWTGTTPRMLPNDFKMRSVYGKGMDWPLDYFDLLRYYEMAEFELGVSGNVDEQKSDVSHENLYGEGYVFPMDKIPQTYLDGKFIERVDGSSVSINKKKYILKCASTPQARNSVPNSQYRIAGINWEAEGQKLEFIKSKGDQYYQPKGALWNNNVGQRCEGNSSCVPICPVQAKYNALKTLKGANRKNLEIVTQAVASYLIIDQDTKLIKGICYKRYLKPGSLEYVAKVAVGKLYVLAASPIENSKLLLASNAGNSNDQVGRYLMDHLCLLKWGIFPEKIFPYRGPNSTTNIPVFRDGSFRKNHAAWMTSIYNYGWLWPVFSPGSDVIKAVNKGLFGKNLREHLNNIITKQFLLDFECEQEPDPENRVTIDPEFKDQIDNYRPIVYYRISEYVLKAFESITKISSQIFKRNGIEDFTYYDPKVDPGYVQYKGKGYTVRGAGHIVGTHRMGDNPKYSVVDVTGRTWDHKNLFLVGCGNMPTIGTSNPTLTMAALTYKTSEFILKTLDS